MSSLALNVSRGEVKMMELVSAWRRVLLVCVGETLELSLVNLEPGIIILQTK